MTFEELEVFEGDVLFSASWCGPCSVLKKNLTAHNIHVETVDVEDVDTKKYGVKSVPALLTLNKGTVENRITGSGDILTFLLDKIKPVA